MPRTQPWSGNIKCHACGHVEATITLKTGALYKEPQRQLTVFPSPKGKMDLRKDGPGGYTLICSKCGAETPYAAEVWRGFL